MDLSQSPRRVRGRTAAVTIGSAAALLVVMAGPASAHGSGHGHGHGRGFDPASITGLASPLGFDIGSDGTVYVAEGFAGQVRSFGKRGKERILVPSVPGQFTSGVAATGRGDVVYTLSLPPEFQDGPPVDTTLNRVNSWGKSKELASLFDFETENDPDKMNHYGLINASPECVAQYNAVNATLGGVLGPAVYDGVIESNPYAVAIDWDGSSIVADAAGNSLVRVSRSGKRVSTVAVFPPLTQTITEAALVDGQGEPLPLGDCVGQPYESNPVPTDVEIGPGGHYYVSALPGFPESPGAGKVFRVNRWNGAVTEVAGGFSGAVDLAVGHDGTIYVAELFASKVSKVERGATSASASVDVPCPTAVEIGARGDVYAAEGGICSEPPGEGAIVKVSF